MDRYSILLTNRAVEDLESIYIYISQVLQEPATAQHLVEQLEKAILSLEQLPYRCIERRQGSYANRGYRQMFVENFTIVYRVEEASKRVIIVTARYSHRDF